MTITDRSAVPVDRTALVTGGAGGIGSATAHAFAEAGCTVVVADLDEGGAAQVADAITARGGRSLPIPVDVRDAGSIASLSARVEAECGRLDAVHVNAATMVPHGNVLQTEPDAWDETFAINTRGSFLTARAVLPLLERDGGGAICFTASETTIRTSYGYAAYVCSKHAVVGLARSIAVDFGRRGIRSNAISPGVTDTPALRALYSAGGRDPDVGIEKAASISALGRIAEPEEVADAVVFLCSPQARFITGAHLLVDGGLTVTYEAE